MLLLLLLLLLKDDENVKDTDMKIRDKDNIFNHHLLCFIRLKFNVI